MKKYAISEEFESAQKMSVPLYKPLLPIINTFLSQVKCQSDEAVTIEKQWITGYEGADISVLIITPKDLKEEAPALVYYHGGGFILKAAPHHYHLAKQYAIGAQCKVIFVDYRLAPKYTYPIPVEDCFAAYKWTLENAKRLKINPKRIAIAGDSAGGNLAAATTLMIRERNLPMPCFQMLIYPVIDRRMQTKSMKKYTDTPLWDARKSKKMWRYYLGKTMLADYTYASPLEAHSLENLPNAYIEIAEFDCLHDEGILYAQALGKAGNKVELYRTKGTIHGFEIVEDSKLVQTCVRGRIRFLKEAFNPSSKVESHK